MALWRRLTKRVARLQGAETHPNDPLLILSWIGALMVTMFAYEAFEMVARPELMSATYHPISFALARVFSFLPADVASSVHGAAWWAHGVLVLGFLNYLPFSKHLHVVAFYPTFTCLTPVGLGLLV